MTTLDRWHIDRPLFFGLVTLCCLSLLILYSASAEDNAMLFRHALRLGFGFMILFVMAQIRPETLMRWTPVLFGISMALLVAVLLFGVIAKGAQRWLNFGFFTFQPSELAKLTLPMMLAWFFARESLPPNLKKVAIGAAIMIVPVLLIAKQPDLGTAILVLGSGLAVLFLAGMSWRTIVVMVALLGMAIPMLWTQLHEYQQQRILTLLDPASDPLGSGYHIIQSMIAIGSGGFFGKGWLQSSQAHLDYLPESSTDFIFAVFAEEFGFIGIVILLTVYLFIVGRGLLIAFYAQETFTRLLGGSLSLIFFFYFFVNIGMVAGILPVVGVPLPLVSYGGTATVTLMAAFGMLMSIHTHRKLVAHG